MNFCHGKPGRTNKISTIKMVSDTKIVNVIHFVGLEEKGDWDLD